MKRTLKASNPNTQIKEATSSKRIRRLVTVIAAIATTSFIPAAPMTKQSDSPAGSTLWAHDNLVAWCAVPFDANKRGPEERAAMLAKLGFKHFAYDWRAEHVPTFDAEIDALKKHDIDLIAWWFPFEADDPAAKATLETFKRHGVHPQLWVMQSSKKSTQPLTDEQQIKQNAERIAGLAKLASPYGCRIGLYNHNGWFGIEDNELAVLNRVRDMGVNDVGLVYNFSHARDPHHDDTIDFPSLWKKIKPHVMAVNITGMRMDGQIIYPSQGDSELAMMRTIEESGWTGPVGVIAEKGGDAEVTLKNYLVGLDWLAKELQQAGSGGPRPFPLVQQEK
jgi:sugar phosphate isomerase/epimerase